MAFPITKTNGSQIATIADGTVDTTATSLTLIGKNYAGYGNFLNENYVKLLENFSNATAPANAITGQLWFDYTNNVLKVYSKDGNWKPISSSASSTTAPATPVTGDLWWDQTNSQLKVWSGTAWITVGPTYTSSSGTTGPIVETILDAGGGSHTVTKFYISNSIIGILSGSAAFVPQTAIAGFTTIYPGFNLISSSALTGSQFTGDVSNALTLQGVTASQFLRSDQSTSTAYTITAGGGVTIGSDLSITPNPTNNEVSLNNTTLNRDLNFYVNSANVKTRVISVNATNGILAFGNSDVIVGNTVSGTKTLTVTGAFTACSTATLGATTLTGTLQPSATHTGSVGSSAVPFSTVYGDALYGNVTSIGTSTFSALNLNGNLVPNFTSVVNYVQTTNQNSQGVKTINSAAPSGGNSGDVWYRI